MELAGGGSLSDFEFCNILRFPLCLSNFHTRSAVWRLAHAIVQLESGREILCTGAIPNCASFGHGRKAAAQAETFIMEHGSRGIGMPGLLNGCGNANDWPGEVTRENRESRG